MYLIPQSLYNTFLDHKDKPIRDGASTINIRQLNNLDVNEGGQVTIRNDDNYHASASAINDDDHNKDKEIKTTITLPLPNTFSSSVSSLPKFYNVTDYKDTEKKNSLLKSTIPPPPPPFFPPSHTYAYDPNSNYYPSYNTYFHSSHPPPNYYPTTSYPVSHLHSGQVYHTGAPSTNESNMMQNDSTRSRSQPQFEQNRESRSPPPDSNSSVLLEQEPENEIDNSTDNESPPHSTPTPHYRQEFDFSALPQNPPPMNWRNQTNNKYIRRAMPPFPNYEHEQEQERQQAIEHDDQQERQRALEHDLQQQQMSIDYEKQRQMVIEQEQQRQMAIEQEQQRQMAIEQEQQRQMAIEYQYHYEQERQRQLAIENEQQQQRQLQLAIENDQQRQLALENEHQQEQQHIPEIMHTEPLPIDHSFIRAIGHEDQRAIDNDNVPIRSIEYDQKFKPTRRQLREERKRNRRNRGQELLQLLPPSVVRTASLMPPPPLTQLEFRVPEDLDVMQTELRRRKEQELTKRRRAHADFQRNIVSSMVPVHSHSNTNSVPVVEFPPDSPQNISQIEYSPQRIPRELEYFPQRAIEHVPLQSPKYTSTPRQNHPQPISHAESLRAPVLAIMNQQRQKTNDMIKNKKLTESQLLMPKLKQDKERKRLVVSERRRRTRSLSGLNSDDEMITDNDNHPVPISMPPPPPSQTQTSRMTRMQWRPYNRDTANSNEDEGSRGFKRRAPHENDDVITRLSKEKSSEPRPKKVVLAIARRKGIVGRVTYKPKEVRNTSKDIKNMSF